PSAQVLGGVADDQAPQVEVPGVPARSRVEPRAQAPLRVRAALPRGVDAPLRSRGAPRAFVRSLVPTGVGQMGTCRARVRPVPGSDILDPMRGFALLAGLGASLIACSKPTLPTGSTGPGSGGGTTTTASTGHGGGGPTCMTGEMPCGGACIAGGDCMHAVE